MPEPVRIKDIPENELTPEQAKVIKDLVAGTRPAAHALQDLDPLARYRLGEFRWSATTVARRPGPLLAESGIPFIPEPFSRRFG